MAHHRLLHLQRRVFRHRQTTAHQRGQRSASGLAQQQGALGIDVDEHDLHGGAIGPVALDHLAHTLEDDLQPQGQITARRFQGADGAAGHIGQAGTFDIDDAEAGALQPRVDAQDLHRAKYQRTEWKNKGAAKHNGATRSSRPTAPVTELRLPQKLSLIHI